MAIDKKLLQQSDDATTRDNDRRISSHALRVVRAISDKETKAKNLLKCAKTKVQILFFLGWAVGVTVASMLITRETNESMDLPSIVLTVIASMVGFGIHHKMIVPLLLTNSVRLPHAWLWAFLFGITTGVAGRLAVAQLTAPKGSAENVDTIQNMAAPIIISGAIGAGKAPLMTHLRHMARKYGFLVSRHNHEDSPYLDDFFSDMKRYALGHELWMLLKSFSEERKARDVDPGKIIFFNGSWREDIWCHSRALYHFKREEFHSAEWVTLQILGDLLWESEDNVHPLMVVYLACQPHILQQRIRRHGHPAEQWISLDYLDTLAAYYSDLIVTRYGNGETYVLNIKVDDLDLYEDISALDNTLDHILRALGLLKVLALWDGLTA